MSICVITLVPHTSTSYLRGPTAHCILFRCEIKYYYYYYHERIAGQDIRGLQSLLLKMSMHQLCRRVCDEPITAMYGGLSANDNTQNRVWLKTGIFASTGSKANVMLIVSALIVFFYTSYILRLIIRWTPSVDHLDGSTACTAGKLMHKHF